jgi:NDP-sugar pyrophosphorylase family protein
MHTLTGITAAILAGGLGTRLLSAVPDRPKVLAEVAGRPFLAHLLDLFVAAGIRRVVLCTGYRAEAVEAAFGNRYGDLTIQYSVESEPQGTGGALRAALPLLDSSTVLVANGDSWCQVDLAASWDRHRGCGARASLLLTKVADPSRFGRVEVDHSGRVTQFAEKAPGLAAGWINAGIYLIDREAIAAIPAGEQVSLEHDIFPAMIGRGLYGFAAGGRFLDIGTPESYAAAEAFFASLATTNRSRTFSRSDINRWASSDNR